jgi:hypothetical protein
MLLEPQNAPAPKHGVPLWAQAIVWIGLLCLLGLLAAGGWPVGAA